MRVLLTGATGFLGSRILESLCSDSDIDSILATGRVFKSHSHIEHPKVTYLIGDLSDITFVAHLVQECDCIINTASLSAPWGVSTDFELANITTQSLLLNAAKIRNVKRYIYISSPSIYANGQDRYLVSEDEPLPTRFINQYARTKYEAEKILSNSAIPFIIIRPRAIIGRGDTVILPRLIKAHHDRKLRIIGDGENIVDLTSVDNVCDAVRLAIKVENSQALNQAYNITNGESIALWPLIDQVLVALGYKLNHDKIPFWVVDKIAWLMEIKSRLTDMSEPSLTRYSVATLAHDFTLDISKARKYLGYEPRVSTQQAIADFIKWYPTYAKV